MAFKITCESSADLNLDMYKKYNIPMIPFTITQGEQSFKDGGEVSNEQLYETFSKTKVLPKTSAINTYDYEEFFKKENTEDEGLIHFSISSKVSSACANAIEASKKFKNVYIIDTQSLSSGIGLQLMYAIKLRDKGVPIERAVELINERRSAVQISFCIDTLTYLYKGGRCSALAMLGANMLGIKPMIAVTDGKMNVAKKYMGKIHKVLEKYIIDVLNTYKTRDTDLCFITYSSATPEMLDVARETLKKYGNFKTILETTAGATVATHCGPNTLGIIFYADDGGKLE